MNYRHLWALGILALTAGKRIFTLAPLILCVILVCTLVTQRLAAQNPEGRNARLAHSPTHLNSRLFAALREHQDTGQDNSPARLELQAIVAQRHEQMRNLMSSDPAVVLAAAVPDDVRDAFPPEVRDLVEQ